MTACPIVETTLGKLQGKILGKVEGGKDVFLYTRIPFAKPPIGELRFEAPVRYDSTSMKINFEMYISLISKPSRKSGQRRKKRYFAFLVHPKKLLLLVQKVVRKCPGWFLLFHIAGNPTTLIFWSFAASHKKTASRLLYASKLLLNVFPVINKIV